MHYKLFLLARTLRAIYGGMYQLGTLLGYSVTIITVRPAVNAARGDC
jgi:hypothetical protein